MKDNQHGEPTPDFVVVALRQAEQRLSKYGFPPGKQRTKYLLRDIFFEFFLGQERADDDARFRFLEKRFGKKWSAALVTDEIGIDNPNTLSQWKSRGRISEMGRKRIDERFSSDPQFRLPNDRIRKIHGMIGVMRHILDEVLDLREKYVLTPEKYEAIRLHAEDENIPLQEIVVRLQKLEHLEPPWEVEDGDDLRVTINNWNEAYVIATDVIPVKCRESSDD